MNTKQNIRGFFLKVLLQFFPICIFLVSCAGPRHYLIDYEDGETLKKHQLKIAFAGGIPNFGSNDYQSLIPVLGLKMQFGLVDDFSIKAQCFLDPLGGAKSDVATLNHFSLSGLIKLKSADSVFLSLETGGSFGFVNENRVGGIFASLIARGESDTTNEWKPFGFGSVRVEPVFGKINYGDSGPFYFGSLYVIPSAGGGLKYDRFRIKAAITWPIPLFYIPKPPNVGSGIIFGLIPTVLNVMYIPSVGVQVEFVLF